MPSVSVEEYIARFAEGAEKPSCEYEDGELIQNSWPTRNHSQVQANILVLIVSRYGATLNPLPALTTRLRETQFYVPDISVEDLTKPIQGRYPGPNDPVLLCVEIMSPPDRPGKLFGKCEEYHKWGVPYCWVIDPERKIAWEYFPSDVEPRKVKEALTAGPIQMGFEDLLWNVEPNPETGVC
jgi:Uma2 family endonuclease